MQTLLRSTTSYRTFKRDFVQNTLSHANLVLFPDEKYLRPLLRECAKAIFGVEDGSREAELLDKEQLPDCIFLPAEGKKLTVDDGGYLIDESLTRPVEGDKKLFVLDGFHKASHLVQNKLLKVLEEPPQGVYFLLGGVADFAILPTVLSRVKRLEEAPFSEEQIKRALERKYPLKSVAQSAIASGGILSVAETLLSGGGEEFLLAEEFLGMKNVHTLCRKLGESKDKTAFLSALRLVLRDALFCKTGQEKYCSLRGESIRKIAREYPAGALTSALERIREAEQNIQFNANYGQVLLTLAIGIMEDKERWQRSS